MSETTGIGTRLELKISLNYICIKAFVGEQVEWNNCKWNTFETELKL